MSKESSPDSRKVSGLRLIAIGKIVKAVLFTGIGFGLFRSINSDLGETARKLAVHLRIDPERHFVRLFLEKVANVDPRRVRTFGLISCLYAVELYIRGGSACGSTTAWAKYMVVIATGFFLPEEAYACIKHFSWERLGFLFLNLAVLIYVIWVLCRKKAGAAKPS